MKSFYNDNEPYVVEWMKNLIAAGHISPGDVSSASISDLEGWQLVNYGRVHLFAGIAGWDLALRLAGFPEDIVTWSGSAPCQPFSVAGKRKGVDDERHLWPVFRDRIDECRPAVIFGEQVASKDGKVWLAGVQADLEALGYLFAAADLEALGYLFAAADLCAAGVGAPHIRQRLYWVAYSKRWAAERHRYEVAGTPSENKSGEEKRERLRDDAGDGGTVDRVAYSEHSIRRTKLQEDGNAYGRNGFGRGGGISGVEQPQSEQVGVPGQSRESRSAVSGLGDSDDAGSQGRLIGGDGAGQRASGTPGVGFWDDFELIGCADRKTRRFKPGIFPLASGISGKGMDVSSALQEPFTTISAEENHPISRVGILKGAGNAIVPPLAAEFVSAFMEAVGIEPIR